MVYDGVRPPGVDQGSIDSFNFLIKRRKQICKDCEMRLSAPGHFSYQFNFADLSAAETLHSETCPEINWEKNATRE